MAERAPRILFIHNNFPAQFGGLGLWLAERGWDVTFATAAEAARPPPGTRMLKYKAHRGPTQGVHPYALPMERAALDAQAFARAGLEARRAGYAPDIVVGHTGWGPGLCASDVFPTAAAVAYCEWWYRHPGPDVTWLAEAGFLKIADAPDAPMLESMRNAPIALELGAADAGLCPTRYQAGQFPPTLARALTILHDGVDVDRFCPDPEVRRDTLDGRVAPDARVVTYATRGMEPHRGFPQFIAALPRILASDPKAVAVVAGENRVAYGGDALRRTDWKAKALAEQDIDPARLLFLGRLPGPDYLRLLQRSDAHVYLTVPFVLSWSMLEAMSAGCALVLSDTAPVREYADASAALLVDMARPEEIATAVLEILADPAAAAPRRAAARARIVDTVPRERCFAERAALFAELAARS